MPTFYADDIDLDPSEFVSSCSKSEIDELINILIEDGYIEKRNSISKKQMSVPESMFEEYIDALHGNWNRLTKEEEEIIMVIAKRFK